MSQKDVFFEARDHNTNLLIGWARGVYTRKECLMSLKFLKDLGSLRDFKVLQPREEGYESLLAQDEVNRYLPPLAIIQRLERAITGLHCPFDREHVALEAR